MEEKYGKPSKANAKIVKWNFCRNTGIQEGTSTNLIQGRCREAIFKIQRQSEPIVYSKNNGNNMIGTFDWLVCFQTHQNYSTQNEDPMTDWHQNIVIFFFNKEYTYFLYFECALI